MSGINPDNVTAAELTSNEDNQAAYGFTAVVKNAFASHNIMALSAAAVLALSGASASAISDYSQTNYATSQLSSSWDTGCQSMHIASESDPWVAGYIDGQLATNSVYDKSLANFSTVYNSAGGDTTVSTQVTPNRPFGASSWQNQSEPGYNLTDDVFNSASTITHAGPNGWTVTVAMNGANLAPIVKDATGKVIATSIPSGGITLGDGTQLTQGGNTISVIQPLNQGGFLTTSFNTAVAHWNNGVATNYMDISQGASGAAVFNGTAASLLVDADTPLLALPCLTTLNSGAQPGDEATEIQSNAAQPTPGPAYDTSGDAAQESM